MVDFRLLKIILNIYLGFREYTNENGDKFCE